MGDVSAIARRLAQAPHATRILKLLVYLCRNVWPTQPAQFQGLDMAVLVEELRQCYPRLPSLQSRVHQVVNTLSKPIEYSQVAEFFLDCVQDLYELQVTTLDAEETILGLPGQMSASSQSPIELFQKQAQIGQLLDRHPQQLRLKKLMLCVIHRTWETDPDKLAAIQFTRIVDDLWRIHNTFPELQAAFNRIVQHLSKPIEYQPIADTALQHLSALYGDMLTVEALGQSSTSAASAVVNHTLPTPPTHLLFYDFRQEMMKVANPLRTKVLLAALLHPDRPELVAHSTVDYAQLRALSLGHLLEQLFNTYKNRVDFLVIKLRNEAEKLPDTAEYEAIIEALVKQFQRDHSQADGLAVPMGQTILSTAGLIPELPPSGSPSGSLSGSLSGPLSDSSPQTIVEAQASSSQISKSQTSSSQTSSSQTSSSQTSSSQISSSPASDLQGSEDDRESESHRTVMLARD
ncbi:hypothetical protein [Alkalinema sp. FACHB-956]|uniref:hypothetical protein n=1 Tax=Alkalinema sp. FACHB-956 TaxID=2692768 RepID=UPI001F54A350|nr:hypothetical protein [Alkalinema sp. FACHB-956]